MKNKIYLGIVYDAMRLLGYKDDFFYLNIKPKAGYTGGCIIGTAYTTKGRIVSPQEDYEILDKIRLEIYKKPMLKNSIVILESNDNKVAHSGDITSMIYQKLGAIAFITDGNIRDLDIINSLKFPTFCKDSNPIDALGYWALTEYQTNIQIEQVNISPGDFIYASSDGIIRVPYKIYNEFNKAAKDVLKKENKVRKLILTSNNIYKDLTNFHKKIGRW